MLMLEKPYRNVRDYSLMTFFKLQEINTFIKLCLPLMAAFLAQKGMQFIDTFMMGWIGPASLAAGALGTGIFLMVLVFCRGTLSSLGVAIVHARGATQDHEIKSLLSQAFYLSICLSVVGMYIAWEAPGLLVAADQDPIVIDNTRLLLHGLTWGIPGFLFFFILREYITAFTLARVVMFVSLISIPLTFISNYVLIYGKYGFPALGIAGIGYASAAVGWFMFLCLLLYCGNNRILKQHFSLKLVKFDFVKIRDLFAVGVSSGVIMILDTIMFFVAALMAGYFGVVFLAAFQIALQCTSIAYNLPLAVGVVTGLEVGHAYSTHNTAQVKRATYLGLFIGVIISLIFILLFILASREIVKLFLPNDVQVTDVYRPAEIALLAAAFLLFFDAIQGILNGALRGLKDTFVPMLSSICCLLVGLGSAYLFAFHTSLGAVGVWYGLTLGLFSLSVLLGLRFLYSKKTRW